MVHKKCLRSASPKGCNNGFTESEVQPTTCTNLQFLYEPIDKDHDCHSVWVVTLITEGKLGCSTQLDQRGPCLKSCGILLLQLSIVMSNNKY